ncbi:MAG: hypothetical protein ACRDQA_18695 [Nocardioidaceae bacterium]
MYAATTSAPALATLAEAQCGVIRRDQMRSVGISHSFAAAQVRAQRWSEWGRNVVLLHNSTPSRRQLMWIVALDAGSPCALGSHTALELAGFRSFASEAAWVHLVVPRGAKCSTFPGVVVHESRRLKPEHLVTTDGPPRIETATAALDSAAWQPWPRFACAQLAAVVQQRLCTAADLDVALSRVGRVRHKRYMRLTLRDIAGGAEALGEIDMASLCRRFHLRQPDRQSIRQDASGRRRYLDCEWELDDGTIVVLEIDGAHHLEVQHWESDMKRERKVVISRRWVLRATNSEVRLEPGAVVADLVAMGVPRL